jgi:hypothetical protein
VYIYKRKGGGETSFEMGKKKVCFFLCLSAAAAAAHNTSAIL